MSSQKCIIIVEDEPLIQLSLDQLFRDAGFKTELAKDKQQLDQCLQRFTPDVILLDINIPGNSGFSVLRELKERKETVGIICVTGRSDEVDRVVGLEIGADDYVTKPFSDRELVARVNNLIRRLNPPPKSHADQEERLAWQLNINRLSLSVQGVSIQLTESEYRVMAIFLEHPDQVLFRDQLMIQALGRTWNPTDRTLDILVSRLRKKLKKALGAQEFLTTIRGRGYQFNSHVDILD
ncbi:response regulator transcription factor [Magnetococcales bacterium HHB-1]